MYIIWKKFPRCQDYVKSFDFIYYNIIMYISDNTNILFIPSMNTTHITLKNRWYRINLNRQILTYTYFFITYEFFFNRWYMTILCM
jgi:hypothetical protein